MTDYQKNGKAEYDTDFIYADFVKAVYKLNCKSRKVADNDLIEFETFVLIHSTLLQTIFQDLIQEGVFNDKSI